MDTEIKTIFIKDFNGGSESVAAEKIGDNTFRLLENPVLNCKINYGTVVGVAIDNDGRFIMTKIVRASNYKTRQFLLGSSVIEHDLMTKIGNPIIEAGGHWEIVMGGIAFIHTLKDSDFDIDALFKKNNYYPTEIVDDSNNCI
ncbi:MAG: hypothetical protein QM802_05390 [Agriterribacter sp.]